MERDMMSNYPLLENQSDANNNDNHKQGHTSSFKTFFNGLNALSGVGILSVPYALASSGWSSLPLIFMVALAAFYAGLLIKRCMEADSTIRSYPDIGERAFGNNGRRVMSIFMCTELYLVVTGFLILEGDNLNNLFPNLELEVYGVTFGGRDTFVVIVALVILPTVLLDNISILSYFSATGVLASLVILTSILWVGAFEGIGFSSKGDLINWSGIPRAILLFCFLSSTITYAAMAIFGYLMFGPKVNSQITLNLPTNKLSSKVAIYTTMINPLSKYALMLEPVASAAESWFPDYRKKRHFRILIRTALVFTQVVVAIVVPFFGSLMSLVGAFLSVTASISLPCLCYLKISGDSLRSEKVLVVGTIVISLLIAIFGTYTSLVELVQGTVFRY